MIRNTGPLSIGLLALSIFAAGCGAGADEDGLGGGNGSGAGGNNIDVGSNGSGGSGDGTNSGESCNGVLNGRIRDFHSTFPDMEPAMNSNNVKSSNSDDRGIVTSTIGGDQKPVYAGPATGTITTTGPNNFDKWYRDTEGVNYPINIPLQFVDAEGDGVWTYDNQQFFPIDGQGFGNESYPHNYHFTFELHTFFTYKGGEQFTFTGDDDVFTYIHGGLVVDLGGIHGAQSKTVSLDTLGLAVGQQYRLDFFFAERHITESHFRIDTTIEFSDCGVIVR